VSNPSSASSSGFEPQAWAVAFFQVVVDKVWDGIAKKIGSHQEQQKLKTAWQNAFRKAIEDTQNELRNTPQLVALTQASQLQNLSEVSALESSDFLDTNIFASNTSSQIIQHCRLEGIDAPSALNLEEGIKTVLEKFKQNLFAADESFRTLLAQAATVDSNKLLKNIDKSLNAIAERSKLPEPEDFPERLYRKSILNEFNMPTFAGIVDRNSSNVPQGEITMSVVNLFVNLEAEYESELVIVPSFSGTANPDPENTDADKSRNITTQSQRHVERKDVLEFLRMYRTLVVRGVPGAGKSTLLRYLLALSAGCHLNSALQSSEVTVSDAPLPIMIPVREYVRSVQGNLLDFLVERACTAGQLNTEVDHKKALKIGLEKALQNGRCIVCVDGLDEIATDEQGQKIRLAIQQWQEMYSQNWFLVTTRFAGYANVRLDVTKFKLVDLVPMTDTKIQEFLEHWFKIHEVNQERQKENRDGLWKSLDNQKTILDMARNPLLLTIIAVVYRAGTHLPSQRVRLYERCVELLLENWASNRGQPVSESERQRPFYRMLEPILREIAWNMQAEAHTNEERLTISRTRLKEVAAEFLFIDSETETHQKRTLAESEAEEFVRFIEKRIGLLNDNGSEVFSFTHPSFQEYFAAQRLYENRSEHPIWDEIKDRLYDPKWREVILLTLGIPKTSGTEAMASKILEKIRQVGENDRLEEFTHRHLDLRLAAIADLVATTADTRNSVLEAVFQLIQVEIEIPHNTRFAMLSRCRGIPQVLDRLKQISQNITAHLVDRVLSAQTLGILGEKVQAVKILLQITQSTEFEDSYALVSATRALILLEQQPKAIEILLKITQDPKIDDYLRSEAIQMLGASKVVENNARIIKIILKYAQNTQIDSYLRVNIAQTLVNLGEKPQAIKILLKIAQDTRFDNLNTQVIAAQTLGILGEKSQAIKILLQITKKTKSYMQISAAQALAILGEKLQAIKFLLKIAQDKNQSTLTQVKSARALGILGEKLQAIDILLQIAQNIKFEDSERNDAAQALGALGEKSQAIAMLLEIAQNINNSEHLRIDAAQALGALGEKLQAVKIILQIVQNTKSSDSRSSYIARIVQSIAIELPPIYKS
jgi:hypothetical protein